MNKKDIKEALKIIEENRARPTHIQLNIDGSSRLLNLNTQERPICNHKDHDSGVDLD